MRVSNFPNCCALRLLSEFGNTSAAMDSTEYTVEQVSEFLKLNSASYMGNMAVLNSEQYEKLHTAFEEHGYKNVKTFYYSGHGNNIHILVKTNPVNEIKTPQHEI